MIPFALHQGPDHWNVSTRFSDLFDLPESLATGLRTFLPDFEHGLPDLSRHDPATQETDARLLLILQVMKFAREKRTAEFFEWLAIHQSGLVPEDLLQLLILYALHADDTIDVETILDNLKDAPSLENAAMSIAEQLQTQGRKEGLEQGLEQGRQEIREMREKTMLAGDIRLLQSLLARPISTKEELMEESLAGLKARYLQLDREHGPV